MAGPPTAVARLVQNPASVKSSAANPTAARTLMAFNMVVRSMPLAYMTPLNQYCRCVYRKCAASCLNDTLTTFGDAQQYSRTTYCCTSNRCNGAMETVSQSTLAITLSMGVLAYLMR